MCNKTFLKNSSGQTLIEALIALSTAVVIVSAMAIVVITSLRNVEFTKTQNLATRYAQEGMEFMRFMRNADYNQFHSLTGDFCFNKGATVLTATNGATCGTGTNVDSFLRIITITQDSPYCAAPTVVPAPTPPVENGAKITITVSWTDSSCQNSEFCHQSKLVSCLSGYTAVPLPGDTTP